MENFTNADYKKRLAKRFCKNYEIKKLDLYFMICISSFVYHDLYFQSDTLLVADVFNNFRNMCLEIKGLDLAHFLSTPR